MLLHNNLFSKTPVKDYKPLAHKRYLNMKPNNYYTNKEVTNQHFFVCSSQKCLTSTYDKNYLDSSPNQLLCYAL